MFTVPSDLAFAISEMNERLKAKMKTVAVAESCTGGLVQTLLTYVAGSSEVFARGWTVHSDQSKMEELAVPRAVIETYGVYSMETARAMAKGAKRNAGSHYAIAVTGVAGPGMEQGVAAGTVFIAISHGNTYSEEQYALKSKTRDEVRWLMAESAILLLSEASRFF